MRLTILIAMWMSGFSHAQGVGKIVGQLGMLDGEILVDNRVVTKNSPIREGSTIEVRNGKATLLLGTGSVFHLTANSKMVVNQFGVRNDSKKEGGDVSLQFGRTRALIQNKVPSFPVPLTLNGTFHQFTLLADHTHCPYRLSEVS